MNNFHINVTSYGITHLGKTFLWQFFNTFFLFYAIYSLELAPIKASILLFIFAFADALFDFPATWLIYKLRTRFSLSFWATCFTPLCAGLLLVVFIFPTSDEHNQDFIYFLLIGILFRLIFTFIDIPLNSIIGQFERSSIKRNYIAASRSIASTISSFIIAFLVLLLAEEEKVLIPENLWQVSMVLSILAPVLVIPFFIHIDRQSQTTKVKFKTISKETHFKPFLSVFKKYSCLLILINFCSLVLIQQFANTMIFIIEYTFEDTLAFSFAWLTMASISALTVLLWSVIAKNYGKIFTAKVGLAAIAILIPCYFLASEHVLTFMLFICLFASFHHLNTHIWSLIPDIADVISSKLGKNMHIPVIGFFAAIGKMLIGIGHLLTGVLLEYSGFPLSPDVKALQLSMITIVFIGIGCSFYLLICMKKQ